MASQNQKPHYNPTQVEEVKRQPTLRLTSNAIAFVNTHPQPRGLSSIKQLKSMFSHAFKRTEDEMVDDLKKLQKSSKTEENVKKIKKLFAGLNQVIDSQRETVISQMEGMPPDQQEAVVLYWEGVEQLMGEILDGLYEKFLQALERIKRGEKLDKKELRAYFEEVYETFKIMFTPEKYLMVEQMPSVQYANDQYVNSHQYSNQHFNEAVGHSVHNDHHGSHIDNDYSFPTGKVQKNKCNNGSVEHQDDCYGRNLQTQL